MSAITRETTYPVDTYRRDRLRRRRRAITVTSVIAAIAAVLFVTTMMLGDYVVAPLDVVKGMVGLTDDRGITFVIQDLRLPRAATGLLVGVALGVSGLLFQRLLNNPLASPDFVGVSSGASLAAVSAIVLFDVGGLGIPGAAVIGALLSAGLIYLLAWRDGVSGYRFILIGIGVQQFMLSIIGYIIARSEIYEARAAMTWLTGSVGQAGTREIWVLAVAVAVLLPASMLLDRELRVLELGDDSAKGLGSRVERGRLTLLGIAILLVSLATAAAGPLAFVALIAGPIARRLLGPASGGLLAAAFTGAVIVLAADLICQQVLPSQLPTGVVTGAVGAPYLIWLLATANREGRGG